VANRTGLVFARRQPAIVGGPKFLLLPLERLGRLVEPVRLAEIALEPKRLLHPADRPEVNLVWRFEWG
jgi:hypothetical protein